MRRATARRITRSGNERDEMEPVLKTAPQQIGTKKDVAALHTEFVRGGLPRISDSGAAREAERVLRAVVTQNGCGRA